MLGFWAHYENLVKIPAKHGQDHSSSQVKKMFQHILDKVIPSPFQHVQNFMYVPWTQIITRLFTLSNIKFLMKPVFMIFIRIP